MISHTNISKNLKIKLALKINIKLQHELAIPPISLRSKFQSSVYLKTNENTETKLRNWTKEGYLYVHISLSPAFRPTALYSADLAFLKATFYPSLLKTTRDSILRPPRTAQ